MDIEYTDSSIVIHLDRESHNINALYKCFYWYGDSYAATIKTLENSYIVTLDSKKTIQEDRTSLSARVTQDIFDYQLREIVANETKNIRELLIAKAFSNGMLTQDIEGAISDPVGFDPSIVSAHE